MIRFFQSSTEKYWYNLQTMEIEDRPGKFHDPSKRSLWAKDKVKPRGPTDHLGEGVQGVFNHADGKRYDSKSEFEKAVRAKGCRVVGTDWNKSEYKTPLERGVRGDYNVRPQLKEAVQKVVG